jgi:hypothetical protein
MPHRDKHSSLLGIFENIGLKKFHAIGPFQLRPLKSAYLTFAFGVTEFITINHMSLVTLLCFLGQALVSTNQPHTVHGEIYAKTQPNIGL